jgi:hypothetical protein
MEKGGGAVVILNEVERSIVTAAAAPLRPYDRAAFVKAVEIALGILPAAEIGPGRVYRTAMEVRREFQDRLMVQA